MIDLHTHTTASDGSLSPEELISLAREIGLSGIAVTDHDTTDGVAPARAEAERIGMLFVPGIEISAEYTEHGTMHILGYFIDEKNGYFEETLLFLKESRRERNPKMITLLNEAGVDITMDDVVEEAGGGQVGRPHFARAMIRKGFCASTSEAFDKYIAKGAPCYVNKDRLTPKDSIDLIRRAGGVPVLAHPKTLKLPGQKDLKSLLKDLVKKGLMGLECYYFSNSKEEEANSLALARELGLLIVGGTDFHGKNKPKVRLGVGLGNMNIPDEVLDNLFGAHKKLTIDSMVEKGKEIRPDGPKI